jgi:hypothetical protein
MRAVWLVLAADGRRHWRSWVLLGLLIAVASGFVLASTAAGRRTDSAFPRYAASHGYDAIVYTVKELPKRLPEVAHATPVQLPFYDQPLCSCHRKIRFGATTVAVVAITAGIPLGIAAGRAIWRAFAISLGVVPVPVVQAWLIVALAAGALLAANALAAVPAMSAARSRPGPLLRTE